MQIVNDVVAIKEIAKLNKGKKNNNFSFNAVVRQRFFKLKVVELLARRNNPKEK